MNETRKMGEVLESERKIREIFEDGTKEDVDLLLALETSPEVDEETRKLITRVREDVERNHHHLRDGVPTNGHQRIGRTPNLSRTEGNND